ncbi:ferrochelatase [Marinobacterium nitratireducens]|uniref:Ferrochelatase n=1 Tax=Marinobacterium nitratireducens TaxID=518897 RepID=A0A917ZGL8_9GAMM|nr:ferrochelatase [Marinobacterium nitratireducens]GGO82396.1 ferrochelatase [Marinobacterium nitratireducens]
MKQQKTAIILVNLGTPDAPEPGAVRRYLKQFLSDPRVVEGRGPRRWLWLAVLNLIILNLRPRRVARLYASIWDGDSPMRRILNGQVAALGRELQKRFADRSPDVFAAMTYGAPGLESRLRELADSGYGRVLVIPLYPQYSGTTTAPIYDVLARFQQQRREVLDIRVVKQFYDHPAYIEALAQSVREHRSRHGDADRLILSYHGIPQEYVDRGDPYGDQCLATSEGLRQALGLSSEQCLTTFQSRFGPKAWLQPYTDKTLESLPAKGIKRVDIISPAFTADCLETLEEIAVENRDIFLGAGGSEYRYIAALNEAPAFIGLLAQLVSEQAGDWIGVNKELRDAG